MTFLETPTVTRDRLAALLADAATHPLLIGDWAPAERRRSFVVEKRDAMQLSAMCGV
jgi:hypothetical protein